MWAWSVGVANSIKMSSEVEVSTKGSFKLPAMVCFGYHKDYHSDQMRVTDDGREAKKLDPEVVYAKGVVYSERPVKGQAEFEVEVISYGTSWSGNLKLGIMLHKSNKELDRSKIPRYTPESSDHCVWCASKLHDHVTTMTEVTYGERTLDDLKEGDRLGIMITSKGVLHFLVNGKPQGIATHNIYRTGHDVYVVVDHYANCKATRITRAIMRVDSTLQELCLDKIASCLERKEQVETLPLPSHFILILKDYTYPGKDSST